jgi:uncharacterized protein (TIRG00374 family)
VKDGLKRVIAVVVAGLALYVALPALARVAGAWPQLLKLSPGWLVFAFLAEVSSFVCTFALELLVLRTKSWFAVVTAGLAGNAVSNLLPGGDAAGADLQFHMLAATGIDGDSIAGGLTAASVLNVGGLLALPVFTLPAVQSGSHISPGLLHAALLGAAGFVLFSLGGVIALKTDKPVELIGRFLQWLCNRFAHRRPPVTDVEERVLRQRDAIRTTLGKSGRSAVLLVAGRLFLDYFCLLAALRATGGTPRPGLVLLAYAAAGIVALVPLTPGGLGVVEASLSGMLVLAGVKPSSALLATLVYRLASYWFPLLSGGVAYGMFRRRYGPVNLGATTVVGANEPTQEAKAGLGARS